MLAAQASALDKRLKTAQRAVIKPILWFVPFCALFVAFSWLMAFWIGLLSVAICIWGISKYVINAHAKARVQYQASKRHVVAEQEQLRRWATLAEEERLAAWRMEAAETVLSAAILLPVAAVKAVGITGLDFLDASP